MAPSAFINTTEQRSGWVLFDKDTEMSDHIQTRTQHCW